MEAGGSGKDLDLLGQDGAPDSGVFVNPALGHPPTETCRLRTASCRESSLQEKGNNELVMFRIQQGLGRHWHW